MRYSRPILLLLFGILTGVSIAVYRVTHWTGSAASIHNGPWLGQDLGNVGTDKLLTARIAVAALYALRPDETIYLVAKSDDQGKPLSPKHDYVIEGVPLAARYWSITLYAGDYFLVPNEVNRFSFNMTNLQYNADSVFAIQVSSTKKAGDWLPSGNGDKFYLALRLYHPEKELYENIRNVKLPTIKRVDP